MGLMPESLNVIPTQVGMQLFQSLQDLGLRRDDGHDVSHNPGCSLFDAPSFFRYYLRLPTIGSFSNELFEKSP